jgi:hypothetical protein
MISCIFKKPCPSKNNHLINSAETAAMASAKLVKRLKSHLRQRTRGLLKRAAALDAISVIAEFAAKRNSNFDTVTVCTAKTKYRRVLKKLEVRVASKLLRILPEFFQEIIFQDFQYFP